MTPSEAATLLNAAPQPRTLPILRVDGGDASEWAAEHHEALRAYIAQHGALLVRGVRLSDVPGAAAAFRQLGDLMTETEAFAPRQQHAAGVYAATRWPANQAMCMHHELSYALAFPGVMLFACLAPATRGGATPVADAAAVLEALPRDLVTRCERDGWLLIRNYNDEIGATIAEAFGTNSRSAVESYCRANAIRFEWLGGGGLRTWQRRSAVVTHPVSGRRCWFNQIAFLNQWTMAPDLRDYLVEEYGEEGLPFNTCFGDGSPVGPEIVDTINDVYDAHTVSEPWQAGDLLLVDNIRAAHARQPFEGLREIVVGMVNPIRATDCAPTIDVMTA